MQNVRKGILRSPRKLMNCNDSVQSSAAIRNFMKHRKYHKIDKCSEEYCRLYINNGHGNNAYNHLRPNAGDHNSGYKGEGSKLGEMFQNYTQTSTESSYFNHNRDDISVLSDDKPAHYNGYTYSEIDAHIWDDSSIPDLVPTNYQRENNKASNNAINYKWLKNHINQSKINREINPAYYYNDSDPVTFIDSLDCCTGEYYNSDECHLKTDRKFRNIYHDNTTQKSFCTYNSVNNMDTNKEWAIDSNHNLNLNHLETYKKLTSIEYFQNNGGYNHDNVSTMTWFRPDDKWEADNHIKNSPSMEHFSKHNHFATFIKKTNGNMSMNSKTTRQNTLADKMKEFSIYPKSCDMQKKCEIENCFTKDLFTKNMKTSQEMYKSNQLICDLYLGTYHIISDLGKGTYGTVKLAYNITEERKVALKFISKKSVMKKKQIQRVHNEVKILSILSHPNICKMYRAIETRDEYVLEMEYVRGRELFNYIKMRKRLTEKEAKEIFLQIVDGVNYLHQHKIIHRDLKPENMIIDDEGRIKIIDFGFLNTFEYGHYSEVHCGSPYYASPEMVNSMPYIGPEVDVWSMGIILYAMVHGKQPFLGSEVKVVYANILKCDYKLDQNISLGLADLIRRIICLDADKRITINEIANHKWISPYHLPIYPKKFIYNAERRVVLRLADFGFVGQLIFKKLKNPLSTESNFYRLLLNKFNTGKVVYNKIGKVLNKKEFFSEMKMIKESMRSHGSKVYPSCGKESHKTFAIMSKESSKELKEINEKILCNKDRLTRRYNNYIIEKRYRYRNDLDYIQVLVAKKESFLMRIFIDTINPLKCNVKFMLLCGNEDIFTEVVSDMISTIY